MNKYITIAGVQYYTTKDTIKDICLKCGFDSVTFKPESISGRYREGYYLATFKHSFKYIADKLRASRKVQHELNKLKRF